MAAISRAQLDALTNEIAEISNATQEVIRAVLQSIINRYADNSGIIPDSAVAAFRDETIAEVSAICSQAQELSASRAAQAYDDMRTIQTAAGSYTAVPLYSDEQRSIDRPVRYWAGRLTSSREVLMFVDAIARLADDKIRRTANECIATNAEKDPAKPRFARVPSGAETCGFCLMLASFGFNYQAKETAAHSHANCDCRIVANFGDLSIEGYDPDKMYERYNKCLDTLGGRNGIRADWLAMPEEKRAAYIARHGNKQGAAFDAYLNSRMAVEIETRDARWFVFGKAPAITWGKSREAYEVAKDEKRDLFAIDTLNKNGFRFATRSENAPDGYSNIDLADGSGVLWEIKSPTGSNIRSVESSIRKAKKQFQSAWTDEGEKVRGVNIVLNAKYAEIPDADIASRSHVEAVRHNIDKLILVTKNGSIQRIK